MKIKQIIIVAFIIIVLIIVGIWKFLPDETNKVTITGFGLSGGQNE